MSKFKYDISSGTLSIFDNEIEISEVKFNLSILDLDGFRIYRNQLADSFGNHPVIVKAYPGKDNRSQTRKLRQTSEMYNLDHHFGYEN